MLTQSVANALQTHCAHLLPPSEHKALSQAIACGVSVPTNSASLFQVTGLIHILVVSGSHLIFLENIIRFLIRAFRFSQRFDSVVFLALLGFTLLTGLQAPCVRAFIQYGINFYNKKHRLFWRPWQVVFISGLITLLLFPNWIHSLSLLLSWTCALALSFSTHWKSSFYKCTLIYLMLTPTLSFFNFPHPLTIASNIFIAPFIGYLLFPLSLLSCLITPLKYISDFSWEFILLFLNEIRSYFEITPLFKVTLPSVLWFEVLIGHIGVHFYFLHKKQNEVIN